MSALRLEVFEVAGTHVHPELGAFAIPFPLQALPFEAKDLPLTLQNLPARFDFLEDRAYCGHPYSSHNHQHRPSVKAYGNNGWILRGMTDIEVTRGG